MAMAVGHPEATQESDLKVLGALSAQSWFQEEGAWARDRDDFLLVV